MDHKTTPEGFSVWHDRHGRKWCWRQNIAKDAAKELGYDTERSGFTTRPKCVADIYEELGRRKAHSIAPQSSLTEWAHALGNPKR